MKVLHIIGGGDVGGAKIAVLSLVKELSKHIEVKLISLRPGQFSDEARAMGIDVDIIKTGNIFKDIKILIDLIKTGNYKIIHSHGAKANLYAVVARYFTHLPIVTTVHSDYRLDYLHNIFKRMSFGVINMVALRFIDYHIGVSKNFKDMLVSRKFDPSRVFTVYNGINFDEQLKDYSRADFAKKYNITLSDDDIVVGILARLHPVKGISTFVKAAREVLNNTSGVKFIIGGDGDERKALERKVEAYGISENVLFIGWVDDKYEFMSSIDINVLTSLSESFPYVILEGTRLKKATISTDVGGISDLIDSGLNGFLFTPKDYQTLAGDILTLVKNPGLRIEIGQQIYEKASSLFSLENMCKTQLGIYDKILTNEQQTRG